MKKFKNNFGIKDLRPLLFLWREWLKATAEIEEEEEEEIPKYVKLLRNNYGFKKGDIAKIIRKQSDGYIVFVPNRHSKSLESPNVWYCKEWTTVSTKEAYDKQQKEFKMKELLEEAKKRYPVGTAFICTQFKDIRVVEDTSYGDKNHDDVCIWFKTVDPHYSGQVWLKGEWAEIVSKPEEEKHYLRCVKSNDLYFSIGKTYKILSSRKVGSHPIRYTIQDNLGNSKEVPLDGCFWEFELTSLPVKEEPIEIAGYTSKFEDGKVSIGCYKDITLKDLKAMKKAIKVASKFGKDFTITEDSVIDNTEDSAIFLDEIEQLIERLDE